MTNEQKYTTLTQSQRLKEIGFDAEADGYWYQETLVKYENGKSFVSGIHSPLFLKTRDDYTVFETKDNEGKTVDTVPSYRLDTLQLVLPEWCFGFADRHDSTTDIGSRFFDELHIHFGIVSFNPDSQSSDKEEKVEELLFDLFTTQGEEAIAAAVDLICLLNDTHGSSTVEIARKR